MGVEVEGMGVGVGERAWNAMLDSRILDPFNCSGRVVCVEVGGATT